MAGSFSSKKVARAARTGGGRRGGGNADFGYYSILVLIVVVGIALVVVSRNERLSASDPGSTPPLAPSETRSGDRWHAAYGVYICDKFAPNINSDNDPFGFSTKNDGIIYIHPFQKQYAGRNATFGRFADTVDLKVDRNSFQLPGDPVTYKTDSSKCGDKDGEVVVKEWSNAKDEKTGEIRRGDPNTILFENGQAITLAFVPKGETNIPLPPSVANLDQAAAAEAAESSPPAEGSSPVPVPAPAGEGSSSVPVPAPSAEPPAAPAPSAPPQ